MIGPVALSFTVERTAIDSEYSLASPLATVDSVAVPRFVDPDMKVTVPVGARPKLPPLGFAELCVSTNTVNIKFVFGATVVALELTVLVVAPWLTVSAKVADTGLEL